MHICSFPHLYLNMYVSLIPWGRGREGVGVGGGGGVGVCVCVCVCVCVGGGGGVGGGWGWGCEGYSKKRLVEVHGLHLDTLL